ncbi:serine/threonine protein kinase, partial [Rhizobium ruizarguesonis]
MDPQISLGARGGGLRILWEDGERALCRGVISDGNKSSRNVLTVHLTSTSPRPASIDRLANEFQLKDHLDRGWAARPLEFVREPDRTMLVLEDPGGEVLSQRIGEPMSVDEFLRLAIGTAAALSRVHRHGLVHKDLRPIHILVDGPNADVHITGFGRASRLPRERQTLAPPDFLTETLLYVAPEQTGRMNRSIDSRSDLYALGVIFYQMLTGALPFSSSDPMELVHCHIARTPTPPHE